MSRNRLTLFVLAAALVAVVVAAPAQAQQFPVDHYKCYDIVEYSFFEPFPVNLRDQFGISDSHVVRPLLHCNPVDKNGEGIQHPDVHLVCYEIIEDQEFQWPLLVENQFGQLDIIAQTPRLLCVPSLKFHTGDPVPVPTLGTAAGE